MSDEKTIERVRKLLSLSHSDNENEAAQAAARASALMAEHAITEAMLEVVRAGEDSVEHVAEQNAFRVGAAKTISNRLTAAKGEAERARKPAANLAATLALVAPGCTGDTALVLRSAERAIAVVDQDRAGVQDHYKALKKAKGLVTGKAIGSTTSRSGFAAGREAGSRVDLGGVGRPALGAGRGALGSGR